MKKIIILDTYPSTKEHLECLNECIDRLSGKGYDLMITSHYPVPLHIQEKVDYYLFDKENTMTPNELMTYIWMSTESFYLQVNPKGVIIAICRNMYNGIAHAKSLGYDFFYFMEMDNLFHEEDYSMLDELQKKMNEEEKKMIFFKNKELNYDFYETLIFGGSPTYFLENIKVPLTVDEYIKWMSDSGDFVSVSLEETFYSKFSKKEDFLVVDESSENYFSKSTINKYSGTDNLCEVVTNNFDDRFILFLNNFGTKSSKFQINGSDFILEPGCWHYRYIENNSEISVLIYQNNEITSRREFLVNDEKRKEFSERGFIQFR